MKNQILEFIEYEIKRDDVVNLYRLRQRNMERGEDTKLRWEECIKNAYAFEEKYRDNRFFNLNGRPDPKIMSIINENPRQPPC